MAVFNRNIIFIEILYLLSVQANYNLTSKISNDVNNVFKHKYLTSLTQNNTIIEKNSLIKPPNFEDDGLFDNQADLNIKQDYLLLIKHLDMMFADKRKEKYKKVAKHFSSYGSMFNGCSNDSYPPAESNSIKLFKINLDDKPEDRWKEVLEQKHEEIKRLTDFFEQKFGQKFMNVVDKYVSWIHQTLPQEYFLEIQGIAQWTGINIGRVTLYNIFYEFFSLCTSVVMEGEDGRMYHGRNLDFGLFMGWDPKNHTWFLTEILRPMIVKLEFYKDRKPLYSAVTYAGYTGILTGVKKNKFSLTVNERFIMNGGYVGIAEWVIGCRDSSWLGLLTRQVMESAESYIQAQKMVATTNLVAPVYITLAGNTSKQGSIVTRGRKDFDIWDLGNRYKNQSGNWYLVETNFDHWSQTPFYDQRREYAVQCMDELGRKNPLDTLYKVLSTRPVLNKETTLTAVMDVSSGSLQVWERECEDPCWPL